QTKSARPGAAAGWPASVRVRLANPVVFHERHVHDLAHFEQPRAGTYSDALGERNAVAVPFEDGVSRVGIRQVRSGNDRFAMIATERDDGLNSVLDPLRGAVRAEVVQCQSLRLERETVRLAVHVLRSLIVSRANAVEQVLIVKE